MARPGLDSPFDETQMKVGRRLAMKVLNASKFVLVLRRRHDPRRRPRSASRSTARCSRGLAVDRGPRRPTRSRPTTTRPRWRSREKFFWEFCDDYLELVKERAYGARGDDAAASAKAALAIALHVQLRLLAPFLPYVTEEVWSWWQEGSIHRQGWPTRRRARLRGLGRPGDARRRGRGAGRHPRCEVAAPRSRCAPSCRRADVRGPAAALALAERAAADLRAAGKVAGDLIFTPTDADDVTVAAEFAPQPDA